MKISTKLKLAVFIPALMALLVIISLAISYYEIQNIQASGDSVRQVRSSITELNHIVYTYVLYREERPKQQFIAEHEAFTQLIASIQLQNPDQQILLDGIRENNELMADLFSQLVSSYENGSPTGTQDRLLSLLLLKSYEADSNAALLRSKVDDGIRSTEIKVSLLILIVMILASIALTIVLVRTRRGIISSLAHLSEGAAVIGSGNLDYKIEEKRSDEIGELSRAFNKMTSDLKTVTASKADLEREIDERKKVEEALRKSEVQLRAVFDNADEGLIVSDLNGQFLYWNPAAIKMHGFTTPEEAERKLPEFQDTFILSDKKGSVLPLAEWPLARILRGENLDDWEIHIRRVNDDWNRTWEYSGKLMRTEEDTPFLALVTVKDVTERKKAEEELKRSNAELEASNKELEAFSYSVSHDLRAPLRSMEGFSSALLEDYADKLSEQGKQYLKYVQESSDLMGHLIDDLLKLSRVTRSDMNYEMVNLSEVAQKILTELQKTEADRKVKLDISPDITAYGDRNLLRLVLENLLGNAWKFSGKTDSPGIEMGVTVHNGKQAYFIRDNGAGFDMAFANKLFQPFQRLHKASEFPGTGIGLATVQRIIRRHGGEIWVESKVGEGATFYFTLG